MYYLIDLKTYEVEVLDYYEFKGRVPGKVVAHTSDESDLPHFELLHPDSKFDKCSIMVSFVLNGEVFDLYNMNLGGSPFEKQWPTGVTSFVFALSSLFHHTPHHSAFMRWAFLHTRSEIREL